jgi:pre-mRNA-splicing factor ATP-dependent RNA helicase DHX16
MGKHKDKSHKRDRERDRDRRDRYGEGSSSKRKRESSSEEEYDKMEKERLRDLRERDEFAERLKKRDQDKTKNVMDKTSNMTLKLCFDAKMCLFLDTKAYEEAAKRLKMEAMDRDNLLPNLRKESRRQYLAKRKEEKVQELEADIMDDEYLFDDQV